jgi:undecaprenyl-diphosphatase
VLQAILLGLIQGLTEFLPVSSSGHLVIIPYLLSWEQPPLVFSVALHFGTILAVITYFAGDLWWLATRFFGIGSSGAEETSQARRTVGLLAVGTVPAALAGGVFSGFFEGVFAGPYAPRYAAGFLLVTAGLLYLAEHIRTRRALTLVEEGTPVAKGDQLGRDESTTTFADATWIGAAQALAIFPGISRSGSTIAAAMLRGLSRQAAARFSFLLSIPVILGATVFELPAMFDGDVERAFTGLETGVGVLVAAVSGWWAIRFLLRLVTTDDLTGFARYVILLAAVAFIGTLWLGPASSV